MRLVLTLIVFQLLGANAFAQSDLLPDNGRLRILDDRLASIIADGIERSPTLRSIVQRIQASNVIVMVETRASLKGRLAGSLHWMGCSENTRYLNVRIKAAAKSNAFVAGVAHELQHVVEIVEAPWVIDEQSFVQFYKDHGHRVSRWGDMWDTRAAVNVSSQVLRELADVAAATDVR